MRLTKTNSAELIFDKRETKIWCYLKNVDNCDIENNRVSRISRKFVSNCKYKFYEFNLICFRVPQYIVIITTIYMQLAIR